MQLQGRSRTDGYLLRTASTLGAQSDSPREEGVHVFIPEVHSIWNSSIPHSANDGNLWAGRGLNVQVRTGIRARMGRVSLAVVPELIHQSNREFQTIAYPPASAHPRDANAAPWYEPPFSIDLPMCFGDVPLTAVRAGQSYLQVDMGSVAAGISTESQWWGPGIRNALLLSNNAPSFVHGFVRTPAPIRTRLGAIEGKYILGRLEESAFFDQDETNDHRSLNAAAVVFSPAFEPTLSIGIARSVYAQLSGSSALPVHALDVFRSVGRPNAEPWEGEPTGSGRDQVSSVFARWVLPASGFESYVEWARAEQPESLRDLLVAPNHSQGYTLGLQWINRVDQPSHLRIQAEATYLEQSATYGHRPTPTFYTSRAVLHGYTHRGESLGASIGPGASSQWVAIDYLAPRWRIGVGGTRIRWNNDALYRVLTFPIPTAHDVSMLGVVRAGFQAGRVEAFAELLTGTRYNYLFQNLRADLEDPLGVDVGNRSLRIQLRVLPPRSGGAR